MINPISYVGTSKVVIILSQFFFITAFTKTLPIEDLGTYALALSIVTPIVWSMNFDIPIKIISNTLETKNLLSLLFPNIFILILLSLVFLLLFVFSINLGNFCLFLLLTYILKFGEIITEIYNAELRIEQKFLHFSIFSSIRFFFVYTLGALAIIYGFQAVSAVAIISLISMLFSLLSLNNLIKKGFYFKINIKDIFNFAQKNKSLSIASGIKFFSSHLMRYFIAFQFGLSTLGYLVPIFYGLNVLTSISNIFENVYSPKISKKISKRIFSFRLFKKELMILLLTSISIIISSLVFSDYYYNFFFLDNINNYHYLLIAFSFGWFFYTLRSILKIISFKFKMQYLQVKIQFIFLFLLIIFMYTFSLYIGILGVAIAFVMSNILICYYYFYQIMKY
mgnify:CR=1 FL=1